tara:strand:- start:64101 stop:64400 length:300 start_codon:yes stop_codon:yes gene_type:complete
MLPPGTSMTITVPTSEQQTYRWLLNNASPGIGMTLSHEPTDATQTPECTFILTPVNGQIKTYRVTTDDAETRVTGIALEISYQPHESQVVWIKAPALQV